MFWALMAADMHHIAIAPCGDHAAFGTAIFQCGIGGDRGAMQHMANLTGRHPCLAAEAKNALHHPNRRISWRCGDLVDRDAAACGIRQDKVGEGATDINTNQHHLPFFPLPAVALRGKRLRKSAAMSSKVTKRTPGCFSIWPIRRSSISKTCGRPDTSGWIVMGTTA